MSESTKSKPSTSFWVISIIALLWNLSGIFSFFSEVFMTQETLAALTDAQRELYESTPAWLKVFYGIAVVAGTMGAIGLLMRKSFSIPLFIISVIAIIIQMSYSLFMTKAVDVYGMVSVIMPVIVISIGIFLIWYSRSLKAKGLLS